MLTAREEFFKHIIDDHIFADSEDPEGWHWYGENKYKAFGSDSVVLVEIADAFQGEMAFAYESYEDMFKGWSVVFNDWLLNYDYFDSHDTWKITIGDIMKLKKYGYLDKWNIEELIRDLKKEDK